MLHLQQQILLFDIGIENDENGKNDDMGKNEMSQSATRAECSTREAARLLGVSVSTVQMWVDGGELEAWKTVGGHRRISRASIERLLQGQHGLAEDGVAGVQATVPGRVTVLVVEDDPDLLSLYEAVMTGWGLPLTLLTASNGFDGLVEIGRSSPNLLITDLNMPGMDGFQMLRTLCADQRFDTMKMVVVSGLDRADIEIQGGLPERVELLRKPVPFERLRALVAQIQVGGRNES